MSNGGKIPGVGYNPGPGTVFWVWPGGQNAGTTPFNPSAGDPFGTGPGGVLSLATFNARYGGRPVRSDGTIGNLVVDAETVLGALTRAMELAAKQGAEPEFKGRAETHTMVPTIREAHDYAAVHQDGGRSLMSRMGIGSALGTGGNPPGQPAIVKLTSSSPGRITVGLKTGQADSFEVQATVSGAEAGFAIAVPDREDQFPTRIYEIELPSSLSGRLQIRARSFLGGVSGKWSIQKFVNVVAGKDQDQGQDNDTDHESGTLTITDIPDSTRSAMNQAATQALRIIGSDPSSDIRSQVTEFLSTIRDLAPILEKLVRK